MKYLVGLFVIISSMICVTAQETVEFDMEIVRNNEIICSPILRIPFGETGLLKIESTKDEANTLFPGGLFFLEVSTAKNNENGVDIYCNFQEESNDQGVLVCNPVLRVRTQFGQKAEMAIVQNHFVHFSLSIIPTLVVEEGV